MSHHLKRYSLVIFDCDGTLSNSRATIVASVQKAFAEQSLPVPSPREISRRVGLSLPEFVQDLCPSGEIDVERLVRDYRVDARARLAGSGADPLFPGIAELVSSLREDGRRLAIATGKSQRGLRALLTEHRLLSHFDSLQTADDAPSKPHPGMIHRACADCGVEVGDAVMIGDTVFDIEAGKNAGCDAVGVSWGYHEAPELLAAGAWVVVDSVEELGQKLGVTLDLD